MHFHRARIFHHWLRFSRQKPFRRTAIRRGQREMCQNCKNIMPRKRVKFNCKIYKFNGWTWLNCVQCDLLRILLWWHIEYPQTRDISRRKAMIVDCFSFSVPSLELVFSPRSFKSRFVNCKSYFSCNFFPSSLWAQLTLFFLCAFRFVSCNLSCFLLEFYSPPLQSICKHCECFESISILRHFRFVSYFFLSSSVFVKVNARNSGRCTCVYLAPYGCAIYQTINILKKV